MSDIGIIIRQHRISQHLSQEDLAEKSALDRTYISMLERGKKSPTIETANRIAFALGTKLSLILVEAGL
mgnify:CR=1 FL=1